MTLNKLSQQQVWLCAAYIVMIGLYASFISWIVWHHEPVKHGFAWVTALGGICLLGPVYLLNHLARKENASHVRQ